jgi:hypothetical protein
MSHGNEIGPLSPTPAPETRTEDAPVSQNSVPGQDAASSTGPPLHSPSERRNA